MTDLSLWQQQQYLRWLAFVDWLRSGRREPALRVSSAWLRKQDEKHPAATNDVKAYWKARRATRRTA